MCLRIDIEQYIIYDLLYEMIGVEYDEVLPRRKLSGMQEKRVLWQGEPVRAYRGLRVAQEAEGI